MRTFVLCLLFFVYCSLVFTRTASAAFRFPIKELGNCRDAHECQLYCQVPKYTPGCWSYNRYGPLSQVLGETTGIIFPVAELGNCNSISLCREFCRDVA